MSRRNAGQDKKRRTRSTGLAYGFRNLVPDHELGQLALRAAFSRQVCHFPASAQDRYAVGGCHHFCQLVRNENDPEPIACKLRQRGKQRLGFLRCQNCGRLIKDKNPRIPIKRFQDLNALFFADGEIGNARVQIDRQSGSFHQLVQFLARWQSGGLDGRKRFCAQKDIVEGAQVFCERKVLMHHPDASIQCGMGRAWLQLFKGAMRPQHKHLSFIGHIVTEKDVHQRGFAGTVFSEKCKDFTLSKVQRHIAVGCQRAKALGDAFKPQQDGGIICWRRHANLRWF